ncbi:MAG: methyltransferase domain-containing protein [Nitrospirota bacterium]|nr:methyltransferase domain-containing protein [Nitrospirota bacterium]
MNLSISHACEPVCPICGSKMSWPIPFFDHEADAVVRRENGYHWRLCRVCANGFPSTEPTLGELQIYWNQNRIDNVEAPVTDEVWRYRLAASRVWAQRSYDFVVPFVHSDSRRFLDVACGLGETVALFQEHGWQAEGVDADPNAKVFHECLGIRTIIGQMESVGTSSRFDLVSIAHAIYFITEPRLFVQRVRDMLDDGGLFLVVLSDLLSSMNANFPGYVHTWYPTSYSLAYLLEREGFEILGCRRFKGSMMVLARRGTSACPRVHPYRTYLAHLSHGWRYCLIGKPLLASASLLKRMRKGI